MPRALLESRGVELVDAIKRGLAVPDSELPRFPKAARWDSDPDFDVRVSALKTVRDEAGTRLDLAPGVLCARDRLEAVARKNPKTRDELETIVELRQWQRAVLGESFLKALEHHRAARTA
jgi:ribonuclease D